MSTFLVTGGGGFIGSNLVRRLVEMGRPVRVLDNFITGKRSNLAGLESAIDLIEGDLRRPQDCARACQGVEVVLHQGAVPSVPKSVEDPRLSFESNATGTFNILLAARDAKVRRFVFAASSSAYGESEELPKHERLSPQPLSPYGADKLAGEHACQVFYECYGLQTISLRYFNVFGPHQDPASQYAAAIPAFVTAILKNQPPTVYGDGEQTRDFTYIENVIDANLLAAEADDTHGEVVNIACGEAVTVNQIIARINQLLGKNVSTKYVAERPGDIKHSYASIELAKKVLAYEPKVQFGQGLQLSIDWYVKHPA